MPEEITNPLRGNTKARKVVMAALELTERGMLFDEFHGRGFDIMTYNIVAAALDDAALKHRGEPKLPADVILGMAVWVKEHPHDATKPGMMASLTDGLYSDPAYREEYRQAGAVFAGKRLQVLAGAAPDDLLAQEQQALLSDLLSRRLGE